MKKKVLATSWHPGGMNAILPVVNRFTADGLIDVVTIGHDHSTRLLDAHGAEYRTINDYSLRDVSLESMKALLEKEAPDLVLAGTSVQDESRRDIIEQTMVFAAKQKGICTLAVLDYWGNYSLRFTDAYAGEPFKFLPDKIAIMDKFAEKDMLKEGFSKDLLVITGNPHFDDLESKARNYSDNERQAVRKQAGLNNELLIFYAANIWKKQSKDFGYWDLDNIRLINNALKGQNDAKLIVKLHPRTPEEDRREITQYTGQSSGKIRILQGIDTQEVVLASDLTVVAVSTVGIEAVYLRKPCISIQPGLKREDLLAVVTQNGIIPYGHTQDDCEALVKRAATDKKYREKTLSEKAKSFRTDGRATERVTNLAYSLLNK
jgi:hypothetical protein